MTDNRRLAGLLLFVGGAQWILTVAISEATYPTYSVAENYISDLGSGPSALIFNSSTLLMGLLTIAAAYNISKAFGSHALSAAIYLAGIGAVGVGIFNESILVPHAFFAFVAFIFGAFSAIFSKKFAQSHFGWISVFLGALSLTALALFLSGNYLGLGVGGMERIVAYPTTLWIVAFGGYLMAETAHLHPGN